MFIIVKNPPTTAVQFSQVLPNVVDNIYATSQDAKNDAMNLANENADSSYVVFELVYIGAAVSPVIVKPKATWQEPAPVAPPEPTPAPIQANLNSQDFFIR